MDALGRIISIIVMIVIILLLPLQYVAQSQEESIKDVVITNTAEFTDTARHKGYISLENYEKLIDKLDQTGELYDVSIEVSHPVSGKEIDEASGDNEADVKAVTTSYENTLSNEENSSSRNGAINPLTAHIHTSDCYAGHNHAASGCKLGYRCPDGAPLMSTTATDQYGIDFNWNCSKCYQQVANFRLNWGDGYSTDYEIHGVRYTAAYSRLGPFTTIAYYSISHTSDGALTGDKRALDIVGDIYQNYYNGKAYHNINTYNQLYSTFPILLEAVGSYVNISNIGETNPNAPYSCSESDGGTLSLVSEVDYNMALPTDYYYKPTLTLARYKCSKCSKDIVHAYLNLWSMSNGCDTQDSYIIEGANAYTVCQQIVNEILSNGVIKQAANGLYNKTEIMTYFKNRAIELGLQTSLFIDTQYVYNISPVFVTSGSTYLYRARLSNNTPHYLTVDTSPICNQVVTSITATNPVQTVDKGQSIITTATAAYLDGHTGTVSCTSNFNTNIIGTQTVTLTYAGLVGNAKTTGTRTCTIQVTVKDPYKLISLSVTPASQTITRYDNPAFIVTAYYDNNTNKAVTGYTVTGFNNSTLDDQLVTITYTEGAITKSITTLVTVKSLTKTCPVCGTVYELDDRDSDNGCPECASTLVSISATPDNVVIALGDTLPITVEGTYRNGSKAIVVGWTSDYDPNETGIHYVTISYQDQQAIITVDVRKGSVPCPLCGREYPLNQDGSDPGCPYCREELINITASPKQVTIEKNNPLPIIVTATYRDGHSEEVTDWATDLTTDMTGTFDAAIYYKTASDHIIVNILDEGRVICPYCGLEYVFGDNPEGCPICSKTVVGIEAYLRNGGNKVTYRANLDLQIVLIFRDTHKDITYTGWTTSGYQPEVLGEQKIHVYYKEFETTLTIEVVDNPLRVICPNGHEYYLNEDGSNPGCPICAEINKDNAVFYFNTTYTSEIVQALYMEGIYRLNDGDYLIVTIRPRETSIRARIQKGILPIKLQDAKPEYTFGGEIM